MHGSRKPRMPHEMTIKRAANNGFIVRHSYDNMGAGESYQPPTEHVFSKHGDMLKHVEQHMGRMGETATPDQKPAPTVAEGQKAANMRGGGVD